MTSKSKFTERLNPKNFQLRSKLIITYILLTVVPMSSLGYISYVQYTTSIEEQVGEYVSQILDQVNENIDKQLVELEHLPELLNNSSQVLSILRKNSSLSKSELLNDQFIINSYLAQTYFNEKNTDLLGVFVWSKGRLFSSTKVPYTGFDKEPQMSENIDIILPNETDLRFEGTEPFILISKPIQDLENRKHLGSILIAVEVTFIERVLLGMEKRNNAEMWFMNGNGQVVYHTNVLQIGTTENMESYPLLNGSFRTYVDGDRKLISVSQSMLTDWTLVHSISFKYLTEKTDLVIHLMIILFVAVVLLTGLISIFVAWSVSRPIHKLSRLMRNVEKSNFQVDLRVESKDEIGMLTNSFNMMVTRTRNLIQQNYQIELRQKQAELYALQSQINPHFMYNTLETINMAVEDDEKETVVKMVTMLGKMMRFSLSNKDRIVTMERELEHVTNYLTIQKLRFEDRLSFHSETDMDLSLCYSPKFILQPIIENCIKHGLESRKSLHIRIHATKIPGNGTEDVVIKVQDDGTGIDGATLADIHRLLQSNPVARRDSGFGLINVHARILMMFGDGYGLTVESGQSEGTIVVIRIPVIDNPLTVEKYDREVEEPLS